MVNTVMLIERLKVMCGITKVGSTLKRDLRKGRTVIEQMMTTPVKRGPDEHNIWHDTHVLYGYHR